MSNILLPLSFFLPLLILKLIFINWPPKTLEQLIEGDKLKDPDFKEQTNV